MTDLTLIPIVIIVSIGSMATGIIIGIMIERHRRRKKKRNRIRLSLTECFLEPKTNIKTHEQIKNNSDARCSGQRTQ